jgi:hypothetical protein
MKKGMTTNDIYYGSVYSTVIEELNWANCLDTLHVPLTTIQLHLMLLHLQQSRQEQQQQQQLEDTESRHSAAVHNNDSLSTISTTPGHSSEEDPVSVVVMTLDNTAYVHQQAENYS